MSNIAQIRHCHICHLPFAIFGKSGFGNFWRTNKLWVSKSIRILQGIGFLGHHLRPPSVSSQKQQFWSYLKPFRSVFWFPMVLNDPCDHVPDTLGRHQESFVDLLEKMWVMSAWVCIVHIVQRLQKVILGYPQYPRFQGITRAWI